MITEKELIDSKNLLSEFLQINHCDYSVVLYGRGAALTWYLRLLNKYQISIDAVVESNMRSGMITDENRNEIPCISLQDCNYLHKEPIFLISAPAHRKIIKNEIIKVFPNSKIFCFDATLEVIQNRTDDQSYKKYCIANYEKIRSLYAEMGDQKSKETLEAMIWGGVTNNIDYYEQCAIDTMYFPDIIKGILTETEVFVDMGAFTGDSIYEFITQTNRKYKKIIAFEPDTHNFNLLNVYSRKEKIKNLQLYKKGCYSENRTISFVNSCGKEDEGAHIVSDKESFNQFDNICIEVVKLDDVIKEEVSYMKMDIEGSELAALKGAKALIKTYHPKLAISAYHKMEDIVELTDFINEQFGDEKGKYRLYLRHFWENAGSDTVLFGIYEKKEMHHTG